jgi:hypothetical protein
MRVGVSKCKNCSTDCVISHGSQTQNYLQHIPNCTERPHHTEEEWHRINQLLREKDEVIRLLRIENEGN